MKKYNIGFLHNRWDNYKSDDWLTPPYILKELKNFDLDPCACINQPWKIGKINYTIKDNGLSKIWKGRVFLNPPYGKQTSKWIKKLYNHGNGIALIFARTETKLFHKYIFNKCHGILFLKGRLKFYKPNGKEYKSPSGAPSCLIAYGENNLEILKKCKLKGYLLETKIIKPKRYKL